MFTKRWQLLLAQVFFGALFALGLAPLSIWPLTIISIMGFFWQLNHKHASWISGACYGAAFFGVGVSWVFNAMLVVETPVALSVLLTALFCLSLAQLFGLFTWVYKRYFACQNGWFLLIAPLLWLMFEWLRSWLFTGMPWLYAGYIATELPLAPLARLVGVFGIGLLLAFVAAYLVNIRSLSKINHILSIMILVIVGFTTMISGQIQFASAIDDIQVAAVQSNIDQKTKWNYSQTQPTVDFYQNQMLDHENVDLMLWPEAALTIVYPGEATGVVDAIDNWGKNNDMAIVTGIPTINQEGRYLNSMLAMGTAQGLYHKQRLVPFGDYLPFEDQLRGLISFFNLPMSAFIKGPKDQPLIELNHNDLRFQLSSLICYEAAYPSLVADLSKTSHLMLFVSNDDWFGKSWAPAQHLQMTQMRAIENERYIVRATQSGISAIIDTTGKFVEKAPSFEAVTLKATVPLLQGQTPYQKYGHFYFILISMLVLLVFAINKMKPNLIKRK